GAEVEDRQVGARGIEGLKPGNDRAVVARPLESRRADGAFPVNLYPVKLVFEAAEARAGRHQARIGCGGGGLSPGAEPGGAGGEQRIPGGDVGEAGERVRGGPHVEQLYLPDGLGPGSGVRPAQGALAELRGVERGQVALPDV